MKSVKWIEEIVKSAGKNLFSSKLSTADRLNTAKKIFALISIYLMVGMVFSAAVFAPGDEQESMYDNPDTYKQPDFWKKPEQIDWKMVKWNKIPDDAWEKYVKQTEIPTEYINKIPPEHVKVTEIKEPFNLNAEQLGYGKNYEKLDLGTLNPVEIANALNKDYGIKDAKYIFIKGTGIINGVIKGPGDCASTSQGIPCDINLNLGDNKAALDNAIITGITYTESTQAGAQTFSGFIICTKDGDCKRIGGQVSQIVLNSDGSVSIKPAGQGSFVVRETSGEKDIEVYVDADGNSVIKLRDRTIINVKGINFEAHGTTDGKIKQKTVITISDDSVEINGAVKFDGVYVDGYNNKGKSMFEFKEGTAVLRSVYVEQGELAFDDPSRDGKSKFSGQFKVNVEDDKLAGYSLYKKGSYAELSEYGFLRNTLTKDAKDKKDGYQFKIFETDEGAVLDLRTLLMQRMKTQQEMNDINEKLKQGKLSKKDAKDALAQLKTFEEQSKKILKEIDGFKERHSSEFDGMGIIGGQIVNLGFVQYGMRNDPIEIKGNDDDTYSAYFVPAQSSSDIKKFLETQSKESKEKTIIYFENPKSSANMGEFAIRYTKEDKDGYLHFVDKDGNDVKLKKIVKDGVVSYVDFDNHEITEEVFNNLILTENIRQPEMSGVVKKKNGKSYLNIATANILQTSVEGKILNPNVRLAFASDKPALNYLDFDKDTIVAGEELTNSGTKQLVGVGTGELVKGHAEKFKQYRTLAGEVSALTMQTLQDAVQEQIAIFHIQKLECTTQECVSKVQGQMDSLINYAESNIKKLQESYSQKALEDTYQAISENTAHAIAQSAAELLTGDQKTAFTALVNAKEANVLGKTQDEKQYYQTVIEKGTASQKIEALTGMSELYIDEGKYEDADKYVQEALAAADTITDEEMKKLYKGKILAAKASALEKQGKKDEAVENYKDAYESTKDASIGAKYASLVCGSSGGVGNGGGTGGGSGGIEGCVSGYIKDEKQKNEVIKKLKINKINDDIEKITSDEPTALNEKLKKYNELLEVDNTNYNAYQGISQIYSAQGKTTEALEANEKASALFEI